MTWLLSSSSDRRALDVVDGAGEFEGHGPHYSRRTPGSATFTGVGREIVLVSSCGRAVWACVLNRGPDAPGTGWRSRQGDIFLAPKVYAVSAPRERRFFWRNVMFRNLGAGLSSDLIRSATERTLEEWLRRYGALPEARLRTEVDVRAVRSSNPGYCYQMAGWERGEEKNGKLFLWAPV
jgi:hypothetical protein